MTPWTKTGVSTSVRRSCALRLQLLHGVRCMPLFMYWLPLFLPILSCVSNVPCLWSEYVVLLRILPLFIMAGFLLSFLYFASSLRYAQMRAPEGALSQRLPAGVAAPTEELGHFRQQALAHAAKCPQGMQMARAHKESLRLNPEPSRDAGSQLDCWQRVNASGRGVVGEHLADQFSRPPPHARRPPWALGWRG